MMHHAWDMFSWQLVAIAVVCWLFSLGVLSDLARGKGPAPLALIPLALAVASTACLAGLVPQWPIVLLLVGLLAIMGLGSVWAGRRDGWKGVVPGLAILGYAGFLLSGGIGRLAGHFGQRESMAWESTLRNVSGLLMAPAFLSGASSDQEMPPRLRHMFRFLGIATLLAAMVAGVGIALNAHCVLSELTMAGIIMVTVIVWALSCLVYILSDGPGRAERRAEATASGEPHSG